ncbi:D-aminoacid aminotransferase-like PLP-dependent enzyme [Exidia glandulosa HHB12029]|uniref:D-aminoacid aminotransferase-like PLP-dependent enzyme n=1 Tax=Exidia glandulosa HHB12029 TaxID=1314781 RepID=A0A165NBS7_EXIGL|nr:D-aminoacid aminotransferase-like PLP-dependent enzyme [Exidia glandulosa HHB12029]
MEPVDYTLFTSLRYDPALVHSSWNPQSPLTVEAYHLDRLRNAAKAFDWPQALAVVDGPDGARRFHELCIQGAQQHADSGPVLLRVTLSIDGRFEVQTFDPVQWPHDLVSLATFNPNTDKVPYPDALYTVTLDTEPTPVSQFTQRKTTRRQHYDAARARAGIKTRGERREVILYNEAGDITEGSVANVSFWREGRWVTPPVSAGGLPGTIRRWLLEQGRIVEGNIRREDINDGEFVLLTNSWHIVQLGRIQTVQP